MPVLRLATTTSTVGSGLLEVLLPEFEKISGIKVEVFSTGTGQALELARKGKADVLLVHARAEEDAFLRAGYGINRHDVMYNEFVLLGPSSDIAGIRGGEDILYALQKIADGRHAFISRGDDSGTHKRELEFWNTIEHTPNGNWYISSQSGMLTTLQLAADRAAYVLSDRGTYLFNKNELDLELIVENDRRFHNPYGVIAVNPVTIKGVAFEQAMAFINFLTSVRGQHLIAEHGTNQFGQPLFMPMASNPEGEK